MEHYTDCFKQSGDTCGACTLMLALYEQGLYSAVGTTGEQELFAGTKDWPLTTALGAKDPISSPINMTATAAKYGLNATLYITEPFTPPNSAAGPFIAMCLDPLGPKKASVEEIITLLDDENSHLQVLSGINKQFWTMMHWTVLRKHGGAYYCYDTAFGTDYEVDDPTAYVECLRGFTTGRPNTACGVLLHLKQ